MSKSYWPFVVSLLGALAAGYPALAQGSGNSTPNRSQTDTQHDQRMRGHVMMGGMNNGMMGGCMQMMQSMSSGRPNEQWRQPGSPSGRG